MTFIEKQSQYKKTASNIGICMLVLIGVMTAGSFAASIAEKIAYLLFDEIYVNIFTGILNAVLYLVYFLVPVIVYVMAFSKKDAPNGLDMHLDFKFPPRMILYIVALIGINLVAAMVNSIIVSPFGFDAIYEMVMPTYPNGFHLYDFVIEIIGTALAPAFVEELLFRGLVLALLLPFGKKTAVFGSAVLFGFMHQNPGQLIYATVAGIILAVMVIESRSIWSGIIAHFINNLVSVVASALPYMVGAEKADIISGIIIFALMGAGAVCAVIIILKKSFERKRKERDELAAKFAELAAKEAEKRNNVQTAEAVAEDASCCAAVDANATLGETVEDTTSETCEETDAVSDVRAEEADTQKQNGDSGEWRADDLNGANQSKENGAYAYAAFGGQDPFAECEKLPKKELIKGFFSKPTIAFLIICTVEMVSLLFVAILMNIDINLLEW